MIKNLIFKKQRLKVCENKLFKRAILTCGGAGSNQDVVDESFSAAQSGMAVMAEGQSALQAVIHSVGLLENDPRFNAGTGSQCRADKQTIQMDASCMSSDGKFGAVTCVEGVSNPIYIAHGVLEHSDHVLIAGDGARHFAQAYNLVSQPLNHSVACNDQYGGNIDNINQKDYVSSSSCDAVGAIAFDGVTFAAALSSGGLADAVIGRVGDVPLPGCGLYCGPLGTIVCAGNGEVIATKILAREVYGWLEECWTPQDAVNKAMALFDDSVDIGLIVLTRNAFASRSRNGMVWSQLSEQLGNNR